MALLCSMLLSCSAPSLACNTILLERKKERSCFILLPPLSPSSQSQGRALHYPRTSSADFSAAVERCTQQQDMLEARRCSCSLTVSIYYAGMDLQPSIMTRTANHQPAQPPFSLLPQRKTNTSRHATPSSLPFSGLLQLHSPSGVQSS
jgi:hypothetical protein